MARTEQVRGAYGVLEVALSGRLFRRVRHTWEANTEVDLQEIE